MSKMISFKDISAFKLTKTEISRLSMQASETRVSHPLELNSPRTQCWEDCVEEGASDTHSAAQPIDRSNWKLDKAAHRGSKWHADFEWPIHQLHHTIKDSCLVQHGHDWGYREVFTAWVLQGGVSFKDADHLHGVPQLHDQTLSHESSDLCHSHQ